METSGLNSAVLSQFGEAMTITVGAVETSVTAIFYATYEGANVLDMGYTQHTPAISLLTSVFDATGADERDTITRDSNSNVYTIISIEPDEGGMTTLGVSLNA